MKKVLSVVLSMVLVLAIMPLGLFGITANAATKAPLLHFAMILTPSLSAMALPDWVTVCLEVSAR